MKIQVNTKNKVITLKETTNIGELFGKLQSWFPYLWKEFSIETNVNIEWINPITVPLVPHYPNPHPYPMPWENQTMYTTPDYNTTVGDVFADTTTIFNVEVK